MRILVTGGAGFIGSHLVEALLPAHEVHVLDNLSTGKRENLPSGVPLFVADLKERAVLQQLFQKYRYEVVYHLAAQVDVRTSVENPIQDAEANILGTLYLIEAARTSRSWIVFTSTGGAIYGEKATLPIPETECPFPESPYGIAKLAGELYLRQLAPLHGSPWTIFRLSNVYGPRQNPFGEAGVVAIFTYRLLAGQTAYIYGDGEQTRDFVFVSDVVRALMLALHYPSATQGQIFNIGTSQMTSINQLYTLIAQHTNAAQPPVYLPPKPGELRRNALATEKIFKATGWKAQTSLTEGIQRTIAYFRKDFLPHPS
ncbi:MAG: NAD-dependent epimerase/dehydratase family protein [Bacteroidia bacterium]|nr:NAD-dependent epimerase/dehydratase family protein [Bacteroidia bacterium]MDW8235397.1 NAD-dependent epimerase/dehydratase family protein [Bacteroidia bacterium]